jgi:putative transcriptional regulator
LKPSDAEGESQVCLRGSLILADPSLRDPNFSRTVLLLTEHSATTGAHGYVLNRPLGRKVGDVLPADEFAPLREIPLFVGGPVATGQLSFASLHWDGEGVRYDTHLSADEARLRHAEGFAVRAFVGYAGWSEGQLESELQQRAWITRKADPAVLRNGNHSSLWADLLRGMGPFYELLAETPEDPSKN